MSEGQVQVLFIFPTTHCCILFCFAICSLGVEGDVADGLNKQTSLYSIS